MIPVCLFIGHKPSPTKIKIKFDGIRSQVVDIAGLSYNENWI